MWTCHLWNSSVLRSLVCGNLKWRIESDAEGKAVECCAAVRRASLGTPELGISETDNGVVQVTDDRRVKHLGNDDEKEEGRKEESKESG